MGTSPRTRGKQKSHDIRAVQERNIPAHAGKTRPGHARHHKSTEHPRARGENRQWVTLPNSKRGTSPRTRGKLALAERLLSRNRNIPAHAGKTGTRGSRGHRKREHPRARGENYLDQYMSLAQAGTSPRTRGKLNRPGGLVKVSRNIPAHAGKTVPSNLPVRTAAGTSPRTRGKRYQCSWLPWQNPEHPRARGENFRFCLPN